MLHFINEKLWKTLFGRTADGLEQSDNDDSEYWILDKNPVTNKFTSVGKTQDINGPNCAFYIAGILEGFLCAANLHAKVQPVVQQKAAEADAGMNESTSPNPYSSKDLNGNMKPEIITVFVIKFSTEVCERDQQLN